MNRNILLGSLSLLLWLTACKEKKKAIEETAKFTVTEPLRVDTSFIKEYVAQIQSVRNIEIRAQEKGYLENIYVDEGQYVHAGQVLFRIMPKMFEAEVLKAEAAVKEAELELANTRTLAEKNIVAKSEQAIAEAKLDEAKADQALARLHLSMTEIKAPFDGVIDRIRFKLGSLIDEGTLLTSLSDNKNVFAYFNVSEREYLDLREKAAAGQRTEVGLLLANGSQLPYKGSVETVEGEFDNTTGTIAFRARFPNPNMMLRHGETGKVLMTVPLRNGLIIPQKSTFEIQDKKYVYVVDKNNVVKSKEITVLHSLPDLYVVNTGLSEGDKILLEGVQNARDDDKIEYGFVDPKNVIEHLQLIKP